MSKFYKIFLVFIVLFGCSSVRAQFDMLYLSQPENPVDLALIEYFTLEGYNVSYVAEDDFKAEGSVYSTADGYVDYDVLFVSESIGSSSANNYMLAGFPIPCVSTEGFVAKTSRWGLLADDSDLYFRQAGSTDLTNDVLSLIVTDNSHWITMEYDQDYNLVWADAPDATKLGVTSFNLGDDIDGAVALADFLFDMGGLSAVWAIPEGSMLNSSTALPNMVLFGIIQTDVEQVFTGDFLEFMARCVRWVTDDYEAVGLSLRDENSLVVGPNPTNGLVHVSFVLPESGSVSVNIYDMTGRLMTSVNKGRLNGGYNTIQLDFSAMIEAQYIFEIITGNDLLTGKIIRE